MTEGYRNTGRMHSIPLGMAGYRAQLDRKGSHKNEFDSRSNSGK
jgi:hypothetical protein